MRKTLIIASALAVLGTGSAFASNDASPFQTPQVSAPAYQGAVVNQGYSAADEFGPSANNALPTNLPSEHIGVQEQSGNLDRGIVTSGVPVKRLPDAATEQFKVSDD